MATAFMLAFAALVNPWLIAMLRRRNWSEDRMKVVAVAMAGAAFIAGYTLDGNPYTLPMPDTFYVGLMAALGGQQSGYWLMKKVAPGAMARVENLGDTP